MKHNLLLSALILAASAAGAAPRSDNASPDMAVFEAELLNTAGTGNFAPYYFSANRGGRLTQSANVQLDLRASKEVDLGRRFSWGAGIEAYGGWREQTAYERFDGSAWHEHDLNGSQAAVLRQLYGEVKFRGVFLTLGMKDHASALLNNRLSSGDLMESGNARPQPGFRVGFIDFQNIPFTNGWVQIQGEFSYTWFTDYGWLEDHFNHYSGHITKGSINNYKRCYFRTKPTERFSVTVGAQCATVFGGTGIYYQGGEFTRSCTFSKSPRAFIEAFLPVSSGMEDFRLGNTLGSWDLKARYRLKNDDQIMAYFEWPWEDGSGIGRRNGFDGLWGLEYRRASKGWFTGAVVEYLDFTNQGGPLHWSPADRPGTTITGQATGSDDYYNNAYYNAYANYGLSIGTPFLKAPLFNTDGYMGYANTKLRGFHAAVEGNPTDRLSYRAMVSYRKAWGNGYIPLTTPLHTTSVMVEARYDPARLEGLSFGAAFALDHGTLLGNNSGGMLTISYRFGVDLSRRRNNPTTTNDYVK